MKPKRKPLGSPVESPQYPKARTQRGTVVEVVMHQGCGLMRVEWDGHIGVCHAAALEGLTPEDQKRIDAMEKA